LTDLHLRPAGRLAYGRVDSNEMATRALNAVAVYKAEVSAVIITGDLTDCGLADEYAELEHRLKMLAHMPVFLIPGNHDRRDVMWHSFPALPNNGGFIQYVVDDFPVRLIMLDTVVAGATHGYLCEWRLNWLQRVLSEQPERETMIAMHHPPLLTGIRQFDDIALENLAAFKNVVAAHKQVSRIICGHHHRMISGNVAQATCTVAPAIAYQFELHHDPRIEVGFVSEPSMFLLHDWSQTGGFISHGIYIDPFPGPFPVLLEPEYPG
jgi:3',5'-cyclic-AMP phosphodiesterase